MTKQIKILTGIIAVCLIFTLARFGTSHKTTALVSPPEQIPVSVQVEPDAEKDITPSTDNTSESLKPNKTAEAEKETVIPEKALDTNQNPAVSKDEKNICTLSVKCDNALKSDMISDEKLALIPDNGIIYYKSDVTFYDGESAFNVLSRELKKNKIHFEFSKTPAFNTAYIEGICNLYEFDCGELSGWLYRVNGKTPGVGCSLYKIKPNDVIEFVYTCDMGQDIK